MTEKAQFNVYLPRELITAVKHRGVDEGVSLSALLERVLRDYVASTGETTGPGTTIRTAETTSTGETTSTPKDS